MKRDHSRIPKDRSGGFRDLNAQARVIERPIRSIGRLFGRLPKSEQDHAKVFARNAGREARPVLEKEYRRLESVVRYSNYA